MKYLGLDWGESKIGVALGSDEMKIASPLCVVKEINEINEIIQTEEIEAVVLGRPIHMSGEDNLPPALEKFSQEIKKLGVKIFWEDERLTTFHAKNVNREMNTKRKSDDDVAAAAILQTYFDKM